MSIPLMIDDRAGSERLMSYPCIADIAELTRLDSADACLIANGPNDEPFTVGIEVKSIRDLMSSMNTGRLQATQLPAMLENYDVRWLAYYGGVRSTRQGQLEIQQGHSWRRFRLGSRDVPFGYLESFLFDVVAAGFNTKHLYSEQDMAQWLACLHRWGNKPWSKHRGLHAFDRSRVLMDVPGSDRDVHFRASVAAALPGLGHEKAVAAARHFPTVTAMVNATIADWTQVPGVGKTIAKAILEAIR